MPIDRDAVLRTAERLLRQGKLDAAIAEYVRLTEDQPRDWNSINTLGDLYVRAGNIDRAVAQFLRIADHLFAEGFLPKAAALYKKALKVKQDHEHTLLRLSEIAVQQELFADAKLYLRQLAQQRQQRGDQRGAAECVLRLGAIDEDDGEAKRAAATAAQGIGEIDTAVAFLQEAAAAYARQNRQAEATDALIAAAELQPDNVVLRGTVAKALVGAGQIERAQPFLAAANVDDDAELLMVLARRDLMAGEEASAQVSMMRAVAIAPDRQDQVLGLADELAAAGRIGEAYACIDVVVDAALFEASFDRAAQVLDTFLARHRIVPALLKLVDVYVDAGLDDRITAVQEQLADAYLDSGQASEARVVAEDLVARGPHVGANVERLRRALTALGVDDVEGTVARQLEVAPMFSDGIELTSFDVDPIVAEQRPEPERQPQPVMTPGPLPQDDSSEEPPARADLPRDTAHPPEIPQSMEIDLSAMLAGLNRAGHAPAKAEAHPREIADVDPATLMDQAQELLSRGATQEAASALQAATRVPHLRFKAAAQLGRLSLSSGDLTGGIEWLERAASAASAVPEETFGVLYDLADALEHSGEPVRALALFMELEAEAGTYRNVRTRIDQLTAATRVNGDRR
jgi:tetratricopeptide (TPR) repeat protein